MINITTVLIILFIHWVADFLCQTDWQAQNKSKRMDALLAHTGIYSFVWMIPMMIMFTITSDAIHDSNWFDVKAICFCFITFVFHTLTDYFTSRLNTKLWNEKKVHWFFASIGFDQFLHFVQLLLTYKLLQ
jgi:hypothetical protein